MAKNTYGLDLGSYDIKVYDKKRDTIWNEKCVIAIKNKREIYAVGDDAYCMYEKTPESIGRYDHRIYEHAVSPAEPD